MTETTKGVSTIHEGIPTMAFLPPVNYRFELYEERYKLIIPIKGTFQELDPEFFTEDDGNYKIISEDGKVWNISILTKVLFAAKMYPALQPDQLFCPIAFSLVEDKLEIIGQVLTMLPASEQAED
jgi:hypothetical protein